MCILRPRLPDFQISLYLGFGKLVIFSIGKKEKTTPYHAKLLLAINYIIQKFVYKIMLSFEI